MRYGLNSPKGKDIWRSQALAIMVKVAGCESKQEAEKHEAASSASRWDPATLRGIVRGRDFILPSFAQTLFNNLLTLIFTSTPSISQTCARPACNTLPIR